ncbi:MAG: L-lactate permease [Lachnospiraceae bacterium]|nr:L-lactate permease [Lachnospiraceae bacterium]MDY4968659.1 L-lactate permease [Lachnospiraceae bacterium]
MLLFNFFLAMLPILWLILALSGLKIAGHKACGTALLIALILSIGYWKLSPIQAATAALEGVLNALWPICIVIIAALFTYNMSLKTGAMDVIKKMLGNVSTDKRVLALIIGWGFGNFMEGMAGFGTAVAIPASMLAGIGMDPVSSVVGCLVVNSTPTAFGSVGVPTVTLAAVSGTELLSLSQDVVLIQCILTFLSPFILVCICGKGIRALKGMIPFTLIASLSFLLPCITAACFIGPELPNIIGSICSMACMIAALKYLPMKQDDAYTLIIHDDTDTQEQASGKENLNALQAWSSFILIFIFLILTSNLCPPIHNLIAPIQSSLTVYTGENPNTLTFSWINMPGVIIFIAAVIGGLIQKASLKIIFSVLLETLKKYWKTVLTICSVMATAKIMSYSGMISDIASLLVAAAGQYYPLIAPLIGALGAFVTGSGTSTNVLFGGLQAETALTLGMDPTWMAAANVMGAGIGKMICPQGIAIGAGAIGAAGAESKILSAVFRYFIVYVIAAGLLCYSGIMLFEGGII